MDAKARKDEIESDVPTAIPLVMESVEALENGARTCSIITEPKPSCAPRAVPVTLVTGFLGSGKTTLLQEILQSPHGHKVAVLINELGQELGVELDIVRERVLDKDSTIKRWIELGNGCICCSVKGSFVQALESMLECDPGIEYVIVETTGMADPGPVATVLWTDEEIEATVCLDSIVTLVDAKNILNQLQECPSEAMAQIAYADLVLINKIDLVDPSHLERVRRTVRAINGRAILHETERSALEADQILNRNEYRRTDDPDMAVRMKEITSSSMPVHTAEVSTLGLVFDKPLALEKVKSWLDNLLWECHGDQVVYRMKAMLHIAGKEHCFIMQAVREVYDIVEGRAWVDVEEKESRVVVIGRRLDRSVIEDGLRACASEVCVR